jgi:hypothetical protein
MQPAPAHRGRCRSDDGAAIVEAAFITPVLMFLLLGVFESSFTFLDYLTTGNAGRGGVRTAAIAGNDGTADYDIVQGVLRNSFALKGGDLLEIVVFEATGPASTAPAGCAGGVASAGGVRCNVYLPSDFASPVTDPLTYGCGPAAKDRYFCPTSRKTALQGANGPPGWVGVYVKVRHVYLTKMFGTSVTMTADVVSRLEPDSLQ